MSGRLTIWIEGREALPVRAIPYVAGWEQLYSPDVVADSFARTTDAPFSKLRNLVAYRHQPTAKPQHVKAGKWVAVVAKIRGFESKLREQRPDTDAMDHHVGYSAWRKRAAMKLPNGVFVWLDEFRHECESDRKQTPDDAKVTLAPWIDSAETRVAVLNGFEDCPRRGPDFDRAIIGCADFVAICHVDNPKSFGDFRVEASGLFVKIPDADETLTPEEGATVTWPPTGESDKPALILPCTLGQLRAFLQVAGLRGCLDEDVVEMVLDEHEHTTSWYDKTMKAKYWLKCSDVKPVEAAMLLCRIEPLSENDPESIYVDDNKTSPDLYRMLLRAFLAVAEANKKPRTLLDYRDVAKREGLRYHQWIDEYVSVRIEELPPASGSGGCVSIVVAGDTASASSQERRAAAGQSAKGVKREILDHWDEIAKLHGSDASAANVARYLTPHRGKSEKTPSRKTVHNRLGELRKAKLIP